MAEEKENTEEKKDTEKTPPVIPSSNAGNNSGTTPSDEPKVLEATIDIKEKPKDKPTAFNFLQPQQVTEKITTKPTSGDPKESASELQKRLIEDEKKSATELTQADFEENSDMIIDFVDLIFTAGFRWYAQDTIDEPYTLQKQKVEKLKKQLTRVLIRYNKAFPILGLFFGTLGAAAITPARKAFEHRKLVKSERAKNKKDTPKDTPKENDGTLRGRGRPRK